MEKIRFIVWMTLLIIGPILIKLYSDKKNRGWDGKKGLIIYGPFLIFWFLVAHVWVAENYNNRTMWIVFFVLLVIGLIALYGYSTVSEARIRDKKKDNN